MTNPAQQDPAYNAFKRTFTTLQTQSEGGRCLNNGRHMVRDFNRTAQVGQTVLKVDLSVSPVGEMQDDPALLKCSERHLRRIGLDQEVPIYNRGSREIDMTVHDASGDIHSMLFAARFLVRPDNTIQHMTGVWANFAEPAYAELHSLPYIQEHVLNCGMPEASSLESVRTVRSATAAAIVATHEWFNSLPSDNNLAS